MSSKLTNAATCKAIETNPGLMFNLYPDGRYEPVMVSMSSVLGTQSSYSASQSEAESGNPKRVEDAHLNSDCDTLSIRFNVRINGRGIAFDMINLPDLEAHLAVLSKQYADLGGYHYLGSLYAANIASGKHAWRNQYGEELTVMVTARQAGTGFEKPFEFKPNSNGYLDPKSPDNPVTDVDVLELGALIGDGLSGKSILMLEIETRVKIGKGQEVYPSQEMVDNGDKRAPSRIYYKDPDTQQAKMHSQKLGNAIRHIDIWHPDVDRFGAIAIEPFGSIVRRQTATRYGNKRDFYTLLAAEEKAVEKSTDSAIGKALKNASNIKDLHSIQDIHYFFAVFMRGGVFGMSKKAKGE
jgi:CRISPR-associated protein Csy3